MFSPDQEFFVFGCEWPTQRAEQIQFLKGIPPVMWDRSPEKALVISSYGVLVETLEMTTHRGTRTYQIWNYLGFGAVVRDPPSTLVVLARLETQEQEVSVSFSLLSGQELAEATFALKPGDPLVMGHLTMVAYQGVLDAHLPLSGSCCATRRPSGPPGRGHAPHQPVVLRAHPTAEEALIGTARATAIPEAIVVAKTRLMCCKRFVFTSALQLKPMAYGPTGTEGLTCTVANRNFDHRAVELHAAACSPGETYENNCGHRCTDCFRLSHVLCFAEPWKSNAFHETGAPAQDRELRLLHASEWSKIKHSGPLESLAEDLLFQAPFDDFGFFTVSIHRVACTLDAHGHPVSVYSAAHEAGWPWQVTRYRTFVFRNVPSAALVVNWRFQYEQELLQGFATTLAGTYFGNCAFAIVPGTSVSVQDMQDETKEIAIAAGLLHSRNQQVNMLLEGSRYQLPAALKKRTSISVPALRSLVQYRMAAQTKITFRKDVEFALLKRSCPKQTGKQIAMLQNIPLADWTLVSQGEKLILRGNWLGVADFEEKSLSGRSKWAIWQNQCCSRTVAIREVSPCTFVVTCEFTVLHEDSVKTNYRTVSGETFAIESFTVPPKNPFAASNLLMTARQEAAKQKRLDSYHQNIKLVLHNTAFLLPAVLPLFWPWSEKRFDQEALDSCLADLVSRSKEELEILEVGGAVMKMLDEETEPAAEEPSPKRLRDS
eukprot:s1203_g2.t1